MNDKQEDYDSLFGIGTKKSNKEPEEDLTNDVDQDVQEEQEEDIDFDSVSGHDDNIFKAFMEGKMKTMMRRPESGSLISKLKSAKNKQRTEKVGTDFAEELLTSYFTVDSSMSFFLFCRLFMNHSTTLMLMDRIEELKDGQFSELEGFELLSNAFQMKIEKRADVQGAVKKAAMYHPSLMSKVKDMFGNKLKISG